MFNLDVLTTAIESNDATEVANIIRKYNLKIVDGKITADKSTIAAYSDYWDKAQHIKKINLNSVYGILLNNGCRFYDKRLGQSITLTGRQIVKHMTACVNEIITGEYDFLGKSIIYNDTDSIVGVSVINTASGPMTIEELFHMGGCYYTEHSNDTDKEYAIDIDVKVMSYNNDTGLGYYGRINYVYRHRVSKQKWEIVDIDGNNIVITGDHSIMIERNGILLAIKPSEISNSDILLTINQCDNFVINKTRINAIKQLSDFEDEWVYDIGMKNENHPWFFANNILVHNSVYFSAYPILKEDIDNGTIEWTKDSVVQLYDRMCEMVNASFPIFMKKAFHCPEDRGSVIKAGREIVASKGLFIKKKRYAVLYYDKEGKRYDKDGKQGSVKAMGLDLKRSDTPKFMQDFLSKVLEKVLTGVDKQDILDDIVEFRTLFKDRPGWEKGSPKRVNNLGKFGKKEEELGKANMPGHVRASINWNMLKKLNVDKYSMDIMDGSKVIVCKLLPNPMGLTSIAFPIDETRLPQWFKELPFDHETMESIIIDKKLQNLIGVLDWDLSSTTRYNMFERLFDFN